MDADETKRAAEGKLRAIANKIGYPGPAGATTRRCASSAATRYGNSQRADAFEFRRSLDKIGKPVDRTEWGMTPPTVNAYYNPPMNNIMFPAGILQPPFFNKARGRRGELRRHRRGRSATS